jgi:hypothetical protein
VDLNLLSLSSQNLQIECCVPHLIYGGNYGNESTIYYSIECHYVRRLLVTASFVPSSPIVTQMKEVLSSSEMLVLNKSHTA